MAQLRAENPEIIYYILTDDDDFMDLVGKRVFKSENTELDAISILTPGQDLPSIKKITGLEVVIHDLNQLNRREYITGDYDVTATWKIFLLAWPGANGKTLSNAASRIMQLFSKATMIETNPVPSGVGAIAQVLVLVPSDSAILAA